ncbi:MAG: hypothetical protein JW955_20640 [Sedimentisphaerales bacterium]|nr:hypothetical protein [Sedimentisphaerales bacterium]
MDTMTNVVGILIILLAVTQLSVGHTIKQIRFRTGASGVSVEEFEKTGKEWTGLRSEKGGLEKDLAKYRSRIKGMGHNKEEARQRAELRRRIGEEPLPSRQALEADIASLERQIADLNEKITAKEKEIEARRSALAKTYREEPKVTEVSIPVLTPAPAGLEQVCFICRKGRVHPFNTESLWNQFMQVSREITGQRTGNIKVGPGELAKIVAYLNQHDVGDEYIRLKVVDLSVVALLRFEPRRPDQGETAEQMSARGSIYMRRLKSVDPKKQFLKFFVWSDSFDTYMSARELVSRVDENLHGKWIPIDKDVELQEMLGGAPAQGGGSSGGQDWLF